MTLRSLSIYCFVGLMSGCATLSSNDAAATGAPSVGAADPAVSGAASSLGIKDVLVQVAISAARNYLTKAGSTASSATQDAAAAAAQKEEAAKAGVQAAADRAKADGQALSEPQQTGLLSALKNLL